MCSDKKCEGIRDECAQKKKNEFEDRQVKELTSMLNNGIIGHYFLLPSLGEIIPNLLADLKNYHLIPANQMENYERIASIDSPFREQLSWVFISVAGRPGMPDRDFSTWASCNI